MIKVRFHANLNDCRPIEWPIKHPYWRTGEGATYSTIVAYADDEAEIRRLWPEATNLSVIEASATDYLYTSRFPKPEWLV